MKKDGKKVIVIFSVFIFIILALSIVSAFSFSSFTGNVIHGVRATGNTVAQFFSQLFGTSSSTSTQSLATLADASAAARTLPSCYTPGQAFAVSIAVSPAASNSNWALSENVPASWPVTSLSNSGAYFASPYNLIKWAVDGNAATTLTYIITPPSSATGAASFIGSYTNATGVSSSVGGSSSISVCSSAPSAPTGLTVGSPTTTSLTLIWIASSGATSYNIYRSTISGSEVQVQTGVSSNTYTDSGLNQKTTYYYKVTAVNSGGQSGLSNEASGTTAVSCTNVCTSGSKQCNGNGVQTCTTDANGCLVWGATTSCSANQYCSSGTCNTVTTPTGLASSGATTSSLTLTWNSISGATYNLYRSTSSTGTFTKVNSAAISSATYTDSGLSSSTAYYYKVTAVISGVESSQSAAVSGTTAVSCTNVCTSGSKQCNGNGVQTCTTDANGCLVWSTTTSCSANQYCSSGTCNTVTTPTGLASSGATTSSLTLTWNSVAGASYKLYRSTSSTGTFTLLTSPAGTSYTDSGLTSATTYYYKVTAVISGVESSQSAAVSGTTAVSCTNVCTSGSKQCNGNGVQTCTTDANGCLVWSTTTSCSANQYCSSGTCNTVTTPTGLASSGATTSSLVLTWNSISGATYNLYRSTSSTGTFTKVNSAAISSATYTDSGLSSSTTYYYKVTAVISGVESSQSAAVSGTTAVSCTNVCTSGSKQCNGNGVQTCTTDANGCLVWGATTSCSANQYCSSGTCNTVTTPTGLAAIAISSSQINLAWNVVSGATYKIYRSTTSGAETLLISTTSNSYSNTALLGGTVYYYKVSAVISGVESSLSSETSATTALTCTSTCSNGARQCSTTLSYQICGDYNGDGCYEWSTTTSCSANQYCSSGTCNTVTTPTGLAAGSATTSSLVLTWNSISGATYNLYRSTSSTGTFTKVNSAAISSATYTDSGLSSSTAYYYKVTAVISGVESAQSAAISGTTAVSCTNVCTSGSKQCNGNGVQTCTTDANGCLVWSTTTSCSANQYCSSGTCNTVTTPTGLAAGSATTSSLTLTWNSVAGASYRLYRSTSSTGTFTLLVSPAGTSYTDSGLSSSTTYYYKVSAVISGVESAQSAAISGTTSSVSSGNLTIPVAPTGLTGVVNSPTQATLYWTDNSNNENGFELQRGTGFLWVVKATLGANVVSYVDQSLTPGGIPYYYRIRAFNSAGKSGYSNNLLITSSNVTNTSKTTGAVTEPINPIRCKWWQRLFGLKC